MEKAAGDERSEYAEMRCPLICDMPNGEDVRFEGLSMPLAHQAHQDTTTL